MSTTARFSRALQCSMVFAAAVVASVATQAPAPQSSTAQEVVRAIAAPSSPLPTEAASAGVSKFSFIAYGDTRGRRDGVELQYEHSLIIDGMLAAIAKHAKTDYPVRFVLQSGDAVNNGREPAQWNVSYVDLINRLTAAGVPYFLAPGNHDVTSSADLTSPGRIIGLRNYLDANRQLIPQDGNPRRLDGYPTFAFGYGNTFVLGLDTNIAGDETQFQWAKRQIEGLDRRRYPNIIAFFHHPPFSSGPHGGAVVEGPTAALRSMYQPLFRLHRVRMTIAGHEHLFEHWIERYSDRAGNQRRADHIVTGGGGAPIYTYQGEPDLREYVKAGAADKVALEHLVKPGPAPGDNPYHFIVVQVDGEQFQVEVIGVDWGRDFKPYRSNVSVLRDPGGF